MFAQDHNIIFFSFATLVACPEYKKKRQLSLFSLIFSRISGTMSMETFEGSVANSIFLPQSSFSHGKISG